MTAITGLLLVPSAQGKAGDTVVKLSLRPTSRAVALATRRILKGVPMRTLCLVATTTFCINGLVSSVRMALSTLDAPVLSNQREAAHLVVVEA